MKSLMCLVISLWHVLLHTIARPFGMIFGGLICGFKHGIQDAHDAAKYLKYKGMVIEKMKKEKENDDQGR